MIRNRKWAFMLGALMVAGIGLNGCEEENWVCEGCHSTLDDGTGGGGSSSDYKLMSDYSKSDLNKANDACKKGSCSSNSACKSGADFVACLCAATVETEDGTQNSEACHTYEICKGIGSCNPVCGESVESCSWGVCQNDHACTAEGVMEKVSAFNKKSYVDCKKDAACEAAARVCEGVAALNPGLDFDGDGASNGKELETDPKAEVSCKSHPCFKDTDGDGISDDKDKDSCSGGDELDPHEINLRNEFCETYGGEAGQFLEMTIARLKGAVYTPENNVNNGRVTTFSDSGHKIVGFFGSGQTKNGGQLLKAAGLTDGTYVEESNFTSSVPLADWYQKGYQKDAQVLPNSDVLRLKYSLTIGTDSLESVAEKIAKVFDSSNAKKPSGNTTCTSGTATLYLARSTYSDNDGKLRIYGGAMTCSENKKTIETMNILDDVLSGTLVAPTNKGFKSALVNGYLPYEDSYCQASQVGKASGAVDFVWVVDNSGSMADELDNVAKTITIFANRLRSSGIDYRVAVTTTDAYAIDEQDAWSVASQSSYFECIRDGEPAPNKYYNALGIRVGTNGYSAKSYYPGFISSGSAIVPSGANGSSYFTNCINVDAKCNSKKNTCGIGYEDGFRSGTYVLSRLAVDTSDNAQAIEASKAMLNPADAAKYDDIVAVKKKLAAGQFKSFLSTTQTFEDASIVFDTDETKNQAKIKENEASMLLRSDALKYIIWVSDEESRQFKEKQVYKTDSHLCLNGNKLVDGNMSFGCPIASTAEEGCNVAINEDLNSAIAANIADADKNQNTPLLQDMSLADLKKVNGLSNYTAMLEYYLSEYRRFAGSGGIAGFALVGDIGNRNGGVCKNLMVCKGTCYADANDKIGHATSAAGEPGCFECSEDGQTKNTGWLDSASAVTGANYGLSYIHLARFLSLTAKENGEIEGKEGGFASVCSTNFETTINSIFEDVAGRVSSHTLHKYPISNTIRVAYLGVNSTKYTELKRGYDTKGFNYDASQNAVVFVGISSLATPERQTEDWFAISYDVWVPGRG